MEYDLVKSLTISSRSKNPIVSREAYRTFISFMFAAAMVAWATTLLGIKPFLSRPSTEPSILISGFPQGMYLVGGILYGCVLIYFYWLYAENIAVRFLPTNMVLLLLDFIALSFMTGAATAWREYESFNKLAMGTLVLLTVRFGFAACSEFRGTKRERSPFKDWLMTHICGIYIMCFVFLGILILGAVVFGKVTFLEVWRGNGEESVKFHSRLYMFVCVGMVLGIGVTTYHSLRPIIARPPGKIVAPTLEDTQPALAPAYGVIPNGHLQNVVKNVFLGEHEFRHLLRSFESRWALPSNFHQSRVHTYRDVETQAFIMAHHAEEPAEIKLRSMWVYLMHWFDDLFDSFYAANLANRTLEGDFKIASVLDDLDERFGKLWGAAITETQSHEGWNRELLEIGMRRLILSGPMFSARCGRKHDDIIECHKKLIGDKLRGRYGVRRLIGEVSDRYLCYTSKVVVEIWDSFSDGSDFDLSMLMNLFYAPGLFYHDSDAEYMHDEIITVLEDTPQKVDSELQKVFQCIYSLPTDKLKLAVKPVRMFVQSFEPIFVKKELKYSYDQFFKNDKVRNVLCY